MEELRQLGFGNPAFREGYEARPALLRLGNMLKSIRAARAIVLEVCPACCAGGATLFEGAISRWDKRDQPLIVGGLAGLVISFLLKILSMLMT